MLVWGGAQERTKHSTPNNQPFFKKQNKEVNIRFLLTKQFRRRTANPIGIHLGHTTQRTHKNGYIVNVITVTALSLTYRPRYNTIQW
jgi:hypothetical protein